MATEALNATDRVWIEACKEALCASYSDLEKQITLGVLMAEHCPHDWCHGILDTMSRVVTQCPPYGKRR